jgi:hypothetical protein
LAGVRKGKFVEDAIMADEIQRIQYYYTVVPDKPAAGANILNVFKQAEVSLKAIVGFPRGRRAQIDLVPSDHATFKAAAKAAKLKLVGPKSAFSIQGEDRVGAVAEIAARLAEANISVTAVYAIVAGEHRYGAILWVKPKDLSRATKVLMPAVTEIPPLPLGN